MQRLDWSVFFDGRDFPDSHFACHSGLLTQVEMQIFSHQEPGSTRDVSSTIKFPLGLGPEGLAVVLYPVLPNNRRTSLNAKRKSLSCNSLRFPDDHR